MELGLKDKVAWVAGASRGIGLAAARTLAQEGCRVFLTGRRVGALKESAQALARMFGKDRVGAFAADVSQEGPCAAAVRACVRLWGRLDVAVLNAGTGAVPGGALPSAADWDMALRANLRAPVTAARAALPHLARANGNIVVIGSIAGLESLGAPVAYAAAKAAVHAWAKALSAEAAKSSVRVNTVIPGNVLFPGGTWERKLAKDRRKIQDYIRASVPLGRFGRAEEVADAVAFLASERAAFITGAALVADGGQTRSLP